MTNPKPNGKIAFITGANRGLGLETARELGKTGIRVVIGSRDPKQGGAAAAKLRDTGITAEVWAFMLSTREIIKAHDYFAEDHGRLAIVAFVLSRTRENASPREWY